MKSFIFLFVVVLLSGCVSGLGASSDDWHQIGYQDGARGFNPRSYSQLGHINASEQTEYDEGYNEGIKYYCNPDYAYQIGLSGQDYLGVCDGMKQGQRFRMEWQRGWNAYQSSAM
ncbi:DUF2799 domain-containing protein [Vibrio marisflavi]|uniref:Lipoprotein n=1 Tax=Vibrio marisflavi CECT 7928 TaxID=634439 RepID=A0ABN8E7S3_9VIBR|nr:DUF2799 domain-containing protein [Vibrio marisflavi]CAH0541120.1 hypothetical protein VMF7928_03388 [Vibrio marisflavi CECT 7928]